MPLLPCPPDRPRDCRSKSNFTIPLFANLREVVSPNVCRTASVRSICNDNFSVGEIGIGIHLCQRLVIPPCDFAEVYADKDLRSELEFHIDPRNVVDGNVSADNRRKVKNADTSFCTVFVKLGVIHRGVTTCKIEDARGNFLDTGT